LTAEVGCRQFFDANIENNDICKDLQKIPLETQVAWESESASEYSPGPIESHEDLVRYWLNPVHYDSATQKLKPTAFDEAARFGASVNRLQHVSLTDVQHIAQSRVDSWNQSRGDKPMRTVIGYSVFRTAEIREVLAGAEARRALGAYDTAQQSDTSHGDICQIASDVQGGRSARYHLRDLANSRVKIF
jgi:hypothetical protein